MKAGVNVIVTEVLALQQTIDDLEKELKEAKSAATRVTLDAETKPVYSSEEERIQKLIRLGKEALLEKVSYSYYKEVQSRELDGIKTPVSFVEWRNRYLRNDMPNDMSFNEVIEILDVELNIIYQEQKELLLNKWKKEEE